MRAPPATNRIALLLAVSAAIFFWGCDSGNNVRSREGSLTGVITDKSGNVLEGAIVSWDYDRTRWGRTASNGIFLVENVGFGDQPFTAEMTGFRAKGFTCAIYSDYVSNAGKVAMETASFNYRNITVKEVSATTALITWQTTDYTNGIIEYGQSGSFGNSKAETAGQYSTLHELTLTGLKPASRYYFRIVASRENRPSETSETSNFTTLSALEDSLPPEAPKGIAAALSETPNQVTVYWVANTETDLKGYRLYRSENPATGFSNIDNSILAKGSERYTDAGVVTGKKYYYRVTAIDQADNESGPSESASMVVPGDLNRVVSWTRANSPYFLSGDIDITQTGVLNIDPGVEIRMADFDALRRGNPSLVEIRVAGAIIASATTDIPVIFTSSKPTPAAGDWGGIALNQAGNTQTTLSGVRIAYAGTGLVINNSKGTYYNVTTQFCQTGIDICNSLNFSVASLSAKYCSMGMIATGNKQLTIDSCTFHHPQVGLETASNDGLTVQGCNFFEYTSFGLSCTDREGVVTIQNNLFVSPIGVGLYLSDRPATIDHNTFDSAYGIRIQSGNPIISKNIILGEKCATGLGFKGIEHLVGELPLPEFGPNDLYGFVSGKEYVGCGSMTGSLASDVYFMKDYPGNSQYDYRLKAAFPASDDLWGISRSFQP